MREKKFTDVYAERLSKILAAQKYIKKKTKHPLDPKGPGLDGNPRRGLPWWPSG